MKKFIISAALCLASTQAMAVQTVVGHFGKWTAYKQDGVCFAACEPDKSEGKYSQRGDIFFMVSHRPKDKVVGEVSTLIGYTFKPSSAAELDIDGKTKFSMATTGETAFVEDDAKVVSTMKRGGKLVVKGTSSRGTATTDTYTLMGFTKAYEAAAKACKS